MRSCPECDQHYPDHQHQCAYCGGDLEHPEPQEKREFVEIWFGPFRWKGMIHKALNDAEIENRDPSPTESNHHVAYGGPSMDAAIVVPKEELRNAQNALRKLQKELPDAFPQGNI